MALTSTNIASHLTAMATQRPDAPAILEPNGKNYDGSLKYTRFTYHQLNQRSDQLGQFFTHLGIHNGSRVAVCVSPGFDFFSIAFALFKIGAVPILIDPGIGLRNFGRCLAEAEPIAFIGIPLAHTLRLLFRWSPNTIHINITTGPMWHGRLARALLFKPQQWHGLPARVERSDTAKNPHQNSFSNITSPTRAGSPCHNEGSEPNPWHGLPARVKPSDTTKTPHQNSSTTESETRPSDPAAILFTSGSTGPPKGVLYSHANFDAQVRALRDLYHIQPGELDLATFPLFGLFGPALGMTTVIPKMNFTQPGHVKPQNILQPILQLNITNMFGSPALLDRVGNSIEARNLKLPSLKRVISAGAPVPAKVMERFATMLSPGVQIFTPYGATESLPVCSIGSDEILRETRHLTDTGKGICVGRPAPNILVHIIPITDDPIENWSEDLPLPPNEIGEIVVQGPVVTTEYFNRPTATKLAKIPVLNPLTPSPGTPGEGRGGGISVDTKDPHSNPPPEYQEREPEAHFFHRMGDVGYFDPSGRLWFCGRKSQRVQTPTATLHSIPVEAIFNTHPAVARSALVGVSRNKITLPVICIERAKGNKISNKQLIEELQQLAQKHDHTKSIQHFLFHSRFPVDIRHNAKIGREKLAIWAAGKLP